MRASAIRFYGLFLAASIVAARADEVVLTPLADTTLSQNFPSNNFGALLFANSGTTQNHTQNRALFRFDFSGIPAGSRIDAVQLKLEVVGVPIEPPVPADVSLHRVLRPWGEGAKVNSGNGSGNGSPASTNEATWHYRFAYTTNTWASPGGAAGVDFIAAGSASNTVYGVSDYYFPPLVGDAGLVADVQRWVDQPATNFGWLLLCDNEDSTFTARRYGAREDGVNTPLLTVGFTPAPLIQHAGAAGGQFNFIFTVPAGRACAVQASGGFAPTNTWTTLSNYPVLGSDTAYQFSDLISQAPRFYRLMTP